MGNNIKVVGHNLSPPPPAMSGDHDKALTHREPNLSSSLKPHLKLAPSNLLTRNKSPILTHGAATGGITARNNS